MKLELKRKTFTEESTIGELYIDGVFECYTLEDEVRVGPKVPGKTAISAGLFRIIINMSQRFQRLMPLLLNVPNFSGIRMHWGNTDVDTDGCILVGTARSENFVGGSRVAFAKLYDKLQTALLGGDCNVSITITEER